MTRTFDAQYCTESLVCYQPKPITTEVENDRVIALAQELEHRSMRLEEETFLELLITLVEKFEAEYYPIPAETTGSILAHLMEARDLEEADLISVLGTQEKIA